MLRWNISHRIILYKPLFVDFSHPSRLHPLEPMGARAHLLLNIDQREIKRANRKLWCLIGGGCAKRKGNFLRAICRLHSTRFVNIFKSVLSKFLSIQICRRFPVRLKHRGKIKPLLILRCIVGCSNCCIVFNPSHSSWVAATVSA